MACFRVRYFLLLTALLSGLTAPRLAAQATQPPHLRELETAYFSSASESLAHAVEDRLLLPAGYSEDLEYVVVVELEVSPAGQAENVRIVPVDEGVSAAIEQAIGAAVRQLPLLVPASQAGQPVRATLSLRVRPGRAAAAANRLAEQQAAALLDSTEARTLRQGLAERRPAEALAAFLGRVLPVSFAAADKPISYAWHPSAYGVQLFFSAPGHDGPEEKYERNLFVLDPIGPATYAVQAFNVQQADYTTLEALFFADANHDGQKDLLALTQCNLREGPTKKIPLGWREAHYQTAVVYFHGLDGAGRPRYEQQYRPDLDELPTAAEVREALAAPPRRGKKAPPRNPRAKAAK